MADDATGATEAPPPFLSANFVELDSVKGSKITGVSMYTGRAEVT
jgi:hypothetical protein